jgi:divalent metal cation (Fe/Co/Zn/Cd) transporter
VAILLARESGALLVGERTNRARIKRIEKVIRQDTDVEDIGDLLTMQLGPDQILLAVDVKFRRRLDVSQLESIIDRIEGRIRQEEPTVAKVFVEADSLKGSTRLPRVA